MSTTDEYHYPVSGMPAVETDHPGRTITPDNVTVVFDDGEFQQLSISGQCVESPRVRVTRRFKKAKRVPEWAQPYLSPDAA